VGTYGDGDILHGESVFFGHCTTANLYFDCMTI